MNPLRILCFAHAREKLGFADKITPRDPSNTPRQILSALHPGLHPEDLTHWRVALDHEYADWDRPVGNAQEMAVIPPVSGG